MTRKRFGQHFLQDATVIEHIIQLINPQPGERIIEIGPGQGVLTIPLLQRLKQLTAVEIDRDLTSPLLKKCKSKGELMVINQDVLTVDFTSLGSTAKQPLRVVGNLPYNISTPLIFHLLQSRAVIRDMIFMLQKEVVDRLAAGVGTKQYGRLSVMVQYYCEVTAIFCVPPNAFTPPPKVESRLVKLVPFKDLPHQVEDETLFAEVVRMAFNQRRKTLRNSLSHYLKSDDFTSLAISEQARPEQLKVSEFVKITNYISAKKC